jgi:hypothetical protein
MTKPAKGPMGAVALRHDLNVPLTIIGAPLLAQRAGQATLGGTISGCCTVLQQSFDRVRQPAGR